MKRCMTALMALMMLFILILPTAAQGAEEVSSLVILGDSISTGYGLNGSLYTRSSYANLIASAMGLSEGRGYVNFAVDGYTSADILRTARAQASAVAEADLIMMTNGGNDVLSKMLMIAMRAAEMDSPDLTRAATVLTAMGAERVNAVLYSEQNQATIDEALQEYRANLTELTAFLKATNSEARVIFLTQYNPLSGVPTFAVLDAYAEDVIGRLNDIMVEVVSAVGYEVVDTHAVMVGQGKVLSNIIESDIHPNALGHAMMAQKIKTYLEIEAFATSAQITTAAPSAGQVEKTTKPSEIIDTTETMEVTEKTQPGVDDNAPKQSEEHTSVHASVIVGVVLIVLGIAFVGVAMRIRKRQ